MDNVIVFLLVVQGVLLIALLVVMYSLLGKLGTTGKRVDDLVAHLEKLVTQDVRQTLAETRAAVQRIDALAESASGTLRAAEPVVSAVAQISTVFQKPTTPLWIDGLRLAMSLFGVLKGKKAEAAKELAANNPAAED
jgi:uncharacterized protein YoxC